MTFDPLTFSHLRRAIPVRGLEAVPNISLGCKRQPLSRDRRARDIAAQTFQLLALVRLARHPGMSRESSGFRDQAVVVYWGDCRHRIQGERLATLARAERNPVIE